MDWKDITRIAITGAMLILWALEFYRSRHIKPGTTNEDVRRDIITLKLWVYVVVIAIIAQKTRLILALF
ncbi:MAG: hypothetical protein HFE75_11445 [Firmicutes bacterium]|nr:hypothetical protein [Bacillota bacterium]